MRQCPRRSTRPCLQGVVPEFRRALQDAGVQHNVEVVPGTHHGFCFAARNDYHPEAAGSGLARHHGHVRLTLREL